MKIQIKLRGLGCAWVTTGDLSSAEAFPGFTLHVERNLMEMWLRRGAWGRDRNHRP